MLFQIMNVSSLYTRTNDQTLLFQTVYRIIDSKIDIVRQQMDFWMKKFQPHSKHLNELADSNDIVTYNQLSLPKNNSNVFGIYRKYSDLMYQLENLKIELNETNLSDVMVTLNDLDITEIEKNAIVAIEKN